MKSFAKFVLISLLASPLVGEANHSWGGYHWARSKPQFTLRVGDNLTSAWKVQDIKGNDFLTRAVNDWNNPIPEFSTGVAPTKVINLNIVSGTSKKNCSMVSGTTQVCNSGYGKNGWLGLATINISGVHITQGSAKMNDSYFTMAKYNNVNEKQHVVCQEIAHTFGLGHQDESGISLGTCMDYFSNTGDYSGLDPATSTRPNYHDFWELKEIYAHLDLTDSYLSSPSAPVLAMGPDPVDHNDPNSWGQLVSQSQNGRGSIYERITGPISKSITHVYWAEEAMGNCPSCDHRYHRFE